MWHEADTSKSTPFDELAGLARLRGCIFGLSDLCFPPLKMSDTINFGLCFMLIHSHTALMCYIFELAQLILVDNIVTFSAKLT